jgi:hypothetical protein
MNYIIQKGNRFLLVALAKSVPRGTAGPITTVGCVPEPKS